MSTATPTGSETSGVTVTVAPEEFALVDYDAATIAGLGAGLARQIGLPDHLQVQVRVDETTPLGRSTLAELDPAVPAAVIEVEGGAFEDPHRPRQLSDARVVDVLARHLLMLRDRLDPDFDDPGPDGDLPLQLKAAWDAYAMGRAARLGHPAQRQRRLYQFRVRHGFSDAADAAFEQLWTGESLNWGDIQRLSENARG